MGEKHGSSGPPRRRSSSRLNAGASSPVPQPAAETLNTARPPRRSETRDAPRRRHASPAGGSSRPNEENLRARGSSNANTAEAAPAPYPRRIIFSDAAHQEAYGAIKRRGFVPSRFLDETILEELGLLEDVRNMLAEAGLLNCVRELRHTYEEPTAEFFSSLEVLEGSDDGEELGVITFRLANNDYVLSEGVLAEILGFHIAGPYPPTTMADVRGFWERISPEPRSKVFRASCLPNPAIRYTHRLLSQSVFARVENVGNITILELHILWGMLTRKKVNVSKYFVKNLRLTVQNQSRGIAMGWVVTAIAAYLGINLSHLPRVQGSEKLDLGGLRYMGLISRSGPPHRLLCRDESQEITLPCPGRTNVRDSRNWLLLPPAEDPSPPCEGGPLRSSESPSEEEQPDKSVTEELQEVKEGLRKLKEKYKRLKKLQKDDRQRIFEIYASMEFRSTEFGKSIPKV